MNDPSMQQQARPDTYLSDEDIQLIADSSEAFPGRWYLDPLVDCRRPGRPRVWVRADELADHSVEAIGFERAIGLVLVTLCREDEDEREAMPNRVYQSFARANISIFALTLIWRSAHVFSDLLIGNPDEVSALDRSTKFSR